MANGKLRAGGKVIDPERFKALAYRLISKGATYDFPTITYKITAGCTAPVHRCFVAGLSNDPSGLYTVLQYSISIIDMEVECRRCSYCLRRKAFFWRKRALRELGAASRTWLATFTVAPEHRVRWAYEDGFILQLPMADTAYRRASRRFGAEMTKYFKRQRKAGYKFRYLMVQENHKDGFPHVHVLIHEHGEKPVSKRQLESEWCFGFTSFKLCDRTPEAAKYVTKYVSKDIKTRVRASLRYGKDTPSAHSGVSSVYSSSGFLHPELPPQTTKEEKGTELE